MNNHLYLDNSSKMVSSFIAVLSGQWATYAIAVLSTAFITRSLGPEDFAKFIQLQFLLGIFTTIGLSISSGVTRYVAEYAAKDEMQRAAGVLKTSFKVTAIIGVIISIIMILFSKPLASIFIGDSNKAGCIEILAIAAGLTEAISPFYAYAYGRQKFKVYALLSVMSFAFMRSGVVLALRLGAGLYGLSWAWLIASILTSFTIAIPVLRMAGRGGSFNLSQLLSYSMPLIASVYLAYLLQWVDSILVPHAGSMSLLAMTSIAMSLVNVSLVLLNSISTVLFTHLVEIDVIQGRDALVNAGYNLSRLLFYCFIPFGFFVGSISNLLIFLYAGEAFSQASLMLKLLSPFMTANAVIFIIWYNEVTAIGKTRLLLLNTIVSLTAYLIIGFILVPLLGVVGYILTKVLNGIIIFPYILSRTKKSLIIRFDFRALSMSALVSMIIIAPSILIGNLTSDYLLTTSISLIGLVCYAFIVIKFSLLTKDEVRIILKVVMRSFRLERQMISIINIITKSQESQRESNDSGRDARIVAT